ncbi:MAG: gliding motility protein GldC [Marinirhabdus sp.]
MAVHTSKITVQVTLDENKVPEKINWNAPGGGATNQAAKALLLSVWDPKKKETLRIDLWTKDMPLEEMKVFFYQTLTAMTATYKRATNDERMAATMKDFTDYFAEKSGLGGKL